VSLAGVTVQLGLTATTTGLLYSSKARGDDRAASGATTRDHGDESGLKSRACFSVAGNGSTSFGESFFTLFTSVLTGEAVISSG
jgi:hypothetical protein